MANGLIPRKRNRSFFQNLLLPEQQEDEGLFGLGRYQPLPEFERPAQQGPAPAPGMLRLGQGNLAPAPMLRGPAETFVNGGDVGARTNTLKPLPAYGEEYRRTHERPERELAPAPGIKRRIAGVAAAFLGGLQDPYYGMKLGQQIIGGRQRRLDRGYERDVEEYESGLERARQRDIDERSQARERRARELHGRYESPEEVQARRAQEAEAQGLTGEAAQSYILTGRIAQPRDGRPESYTRTRSGGESELLERRPGEEYYRPAEMLAPGVEEIAPPITLEHGGVGGQPIELPGPRPPTEAVVSHPRPTRPLARAVTAEVNRMVEGTATEALEKANGDPNRAIAIVNASENIPPEHKQKVRNRIREKVRPGARSQQGGLEEEINKALRGLEQ